MSVHTCRESPNPRNAGWCACGRKLELVEPMRRDQKLEREITAEACRGAVDPASLEVFSESRIALSRDPSTVRPGLDLLREAREELADCRNYLVWFVQQNIGSEPAQDALISLRHVALAFDRLLDA